MDNRSARNRNPRIGRYSEEGRIYFVTSCCYQHQDHFFHPESAEILMAEFKRQSASGACKNLAYVVMPDHIHWLLQLTSRSTLSEAVRSLKGRTAREINLVLPSPIRVRQRGFHDYALRKEEDIKGTGTYLIYNPLRAGLVTDVDDYPYWGSIWHQRRG